MRVKFFIDWDDFPKFQEGKSVALYGNCRPDTARIGISADVDEVEAIEGLKAMLKATIRKKPVTKPEGTPHPSGFLKNKQKEGEGK